ncbi:IS256 family transposase [Cellulomonas composti]|uniref:Mutator family transposase n=1 Tax=Cellulomonas composti TaxID=266130 RepID=A0A511JEM9_9CELL|nr:IS256 family transposase [Cellulomonas composti]GEL96432.1 IS256 family transposase [Cellulomonas composti]
MTDELSSGELVPVRPGASFQDLDRLAEELVASAASQRVQLTGDGGLLTAFTRRVLQAALEAEMSAHLGYDKHDPMGRNGGNSRNGSTPKTVRTEVGQVTIEVPRDRAGTFEPQIVPKHQRRLAGFDEAVISLYAKGMTTGDICAHLSEVYDTDVSRDLVSRVTDQVLRDMRGWQSRPLDTVYPVVLIDAIVLKVRSTAAGVGNRPVYVAMGINLEGQRDVLGLWVGPTGGEGAKQWMNMLSELRNRGILDVCIVCCDGLKGLPEAIVATWPAASVQTCVVHLVRNTLRYSSKKYWQAIIRELKAVYTAATPEAAELEFEQFAAKWEPLYPAMISMWRRSWGEFVPFLAFPIEVRRIIYTTNGIESLNARFRAATRRRGHFPDEESALKVLYLAVLQRDKNRANPTGQINGWKNILNVLSLTYGDRLGLN